MDVRKTRWIPLVLMLMILAGVAARQQTTGRVGYVNLQRIMQQTPGYQEARDTFELFQQGFEDEVNGLQSSLDSAISAFEQQQVVLSPTARQQKQTELQQMNTRAQQRMQEIQVRMQARERELLTPLEDRVQAVIDGLRAERNISMIFDVSAPGSTIIAADTNLDLSGLVIQRLQAAN